MVGFESEMDRRAFMDVADFGSTVEMRSSDQEEFGQPLPVIFDAPGDILSFGEMDLQDRQPQITIETRLIPDALSNTWQVRHDGILYSPHPQDDDGTGFSVIRLERIDA